MPNSRNYGKVYHKLALLVIAGIIILAPLEILSNDGFAQTVHDRTLYEKTKETSGLDENAQIVLDDSPSKIAVYNDQFHAKTIYVTSFGFDTVSVIYTENDTVIKKIPIPKPTSIVMGSTLNSEVYVSYLNRVAAIFANNNTVIADIPVGYEFIHDIAFNGTELFVSRNDTIVAIQIGQFGGLAGFIQNLGPSGYAHNAGITEVISVGGAIEDIAIDEALNHLYVLYKTVPNSENVTVNNVSYRISEIWNNIVVADIPVAGLPTAIAANRGTIYLINNSSNSVSVIKNNTKLGPDIPVGYYPTDIAVDYNSNIAYVTNHDSNSVSVIKNNTKLGPDIPTGNGPVAIDVDNYEHTIYVANAISDSVSVIDGTANRVVAGVTFQVNPFNSGNIVCDVLSTPSPDDLTPPSPIGQYMYVYSGSECTAKPNEGFEFSSWDENLGPNSTQPINASSPTSSWDSFLEVLHLKSANKPEAILKITKFGTFTANFRELPPPLPPEFWAQMYAVIGTVVTALFIPSIIGWFKSKREGKKLSYFHKQIASLYGDGKLDENDIGSLDLLRNRIGDAYSEGKLNEKHYESLRNEVSVLYEKIFRKKIDELRNESNASPIRKSGQEQSALKNVIKYAYSEGKINEKHYKLLNEDISKLDGKESNNTSQSPKAGD